jgi:hypothetical protein
MFRNSATARLGEGRDIKCWCVGYFKEKMTRVGGSRG